MHLSSYETLKEKRAPLDKKRFKQVLLQSYFARKQSANKYHHYLIEVYYMLSGLILTKIDKMYSYHLRVKRSTDFRAFAPENKQQGFTVDDFVTITKNDLAHEAYTILDDCIKMLNVDKIESFQYYYNKTLSRRLHNTFEADSGQILYTLDAVSFESTDSFHENADKTIFDSDMEIDLARLNFTELEQKIIKSKLAEQSLKAFVEEQKLIDPQFTNAQYNQILLNIKKKLQSSVRSEYIQNSRIRE